MDITEIVRARSFATSYTLEHLVGNGKVELKDWKQWADVLYAYLTQDLKDVKLTDKNLYPYGGGQGKGGTGGKAPADGGETTMGAAQWELWKNLRDIVGGNIDEAKRLLKAITTFKGKDGRMFEGYDSVKATSDKVAKIATQNIKKLVEKNCAKKAVSCDHSEWEADVCYCKALGGGKLCMFTYENVADVPASPPEVDKEIF